MDFDKWLVQKRRLITKKATIFIDKKKWEKLVKIFFAFYVAYIVISAFIYPAFLYYSIYNPLASDHIESYLDKTSETILLKSSNNTEIADNIVKWELNEFIRGSDIFSNFLDPFGYRIPKSAGWYIFLNRGNCGERAIIFNDMATRTGLKYRKVVVDGFINSKYNSSGDHSWSEVLLEDGSWVIADSGFNVSPLYTNKSVFCSEKNMLLGPVFIYENTMVVQDCTEEYVDNTARLKIKAVRDGGPIDNSSIQIILNYNNKSKMVAGALGRFIKFKTNESGHSVVTLGVYNNASYTIRVLDGIYYGEKKVVLGNSTEEIEVEVNKLRPNIVASVFAYIVLCVLIGRKYALSKKSVKKEKHEKL